MEEVTINGNGHTIYGNMYDSRIFNVTADEVSISNITFKNPNFSLENTQSYTDKGNYILGYNSAYSPVTVSGDYDELTNCIFIGTSAVNGGSLYWNGNMGKIESCTFLNSTATAFGGAIFMGGYHNKVTNSTIINCDSGLSGEAVYSADDRKKISFIDCFTTDTKGLYDGKASNLDPELFHNSYLTAVADKKLDIFPLLYKSIAIGGIFYLDNDTGYYSEYFNTTKDLIFTIYRNFTDNGILYSKGYHFKNIKEITDVFPLMLNSSYSLDIDITKNLYVNDINNYKTAITTTEACLEPVMKYAKQDGLENIKNKVLTINLKKEMTIDCKNTIKPDSLGFNVFNIAGNGAIIKTSSDDRDENTWVKMEDNGMTFSANNLTVTGFNTGLENMAGTCIFNRVTFKNNHKDYILDRDWGGAMLNVGITMCYNCHFENNEAKHRGAIFNQGYLHLDNCSFVNNDADNGKGDDICIGDNGELIYDGQNITSSIDKNELHVTVAKSMSLKDTTLIETACIVGSFLVGAVVGIATANPIIGAAVGGAFGLVAGGVCAAVVINSHYDVHFNRLKHALICIGGSIAAGIVGGIIGGYIGSSVAPTTTEGRIAEVAAANEQGLVREALVEAKLHGIAVKLI